jgi:flagellar biosynthesis protein FliR
VTATAAAGWAAARLVPLALVATPLDGGGWIGRALVALLLVAGATPFVAAQPVAAGAWAREPLVGLTLGLMAALPFAAARAAGALVDVGVHPWRARRVGPRGRGPLADATALWALALFAVADGPARTLRAALGSYAALPLGGAPALPSLLALGSALVATAAALAAPALAALLAADLTLALLARAQPALARAVDGAPLRLVAALLVLAGGVFSLARALAPSLRAAAELRLP